MATVAPDTVVRASVAEAGGLSFEGSPASVSMHYADGTVAEAASIEVRSCPDLITCTWELHGVEVSAAVEVVASRFCSLESIICYRADQYQLNELYNPDDSEVWAARAQAESTIEESCRRALQPVVRMGFVDRPGCRTHTMVIGPGGYDPDLKRIVSARLADGEPAPVRQLRPGSPYLDVSGMRPGTGAEVAYVSGLPAIPAGASEAVAALAAWLLSPKTSPENATSTSTEAGVISFVVGGVDGAPTSLPEVNALIQRWGLADAEVG